MALDTQNWMKPIWDNPKQYEGKFVVHDEKNVLFISADIKEADDWRTKNQIQYEIALHLFLVPNHFGSVRLRMLKIKSLSAGEWTHLPHPQI